MPASPNTMFTGTAGPGENKPGPNRLLGRFVMYVVFTLLAPVGVMIFGLWVYLFYFFRIKWWVPAASFGVLIVLGFVTGNLVLGDIISSYIAPWKDMFASPDNPLDWLFNNWVSLLAAQFWLGLLLGTAYAGVSIAYKWVRRPVWQERSIRPGPLLKSREKKTRKEISEDKDTPESGITLGVSVDRRDDRFAGGKPGEEYGKRVVISDGESAGHVLVVGGAGSGKALDVETPIATPDRGFVKMGDLKVGDKVFGSDGNPTTVVGAYDIMDNHECYEVKFSDGSTVVADGEHLWTVDTVQSRKSLDRRNKEPHAYKTIGTDSEIEKVRFALSQAKESDVVTSSHLASMLEKKPVSAVSYALSILNTIPKSGTTRIGPFKQNYSGKIVLKTQMATTWPAVIAYEATLARLETILHDQRHKRLDIPVTLTTEQIAESIIHKSGRHEYSIPLSGVVQYPETKNLLMDPYLLGLYLGDGGTKKPMFTTADEELIQVWRNAGFECTLIKGSKYDFYIKGLLPTMKKLNIYDNKHIPDSYLFSSEAQRRELLAGLLDSDGTHEGQGRVSYTSKLPALAKQFKTLAASLGYRPTTTSKNVTLEDGRIVGPYYTVAFITMDDVFHLTRKLDKHRLGRSTSNPKKHQRRYILSVEKVPTRPVRCIAVDSPDHLFLAGETYIATHNTSTMLVGIRDLIKQGRGVVIVDCKGGPDVPEQVADWCDRYGRKFYHWSITDPSEPYHGPADGPAFYDPLSRGDASRKKDLLMGSQKWDVEYYKSVIGNYLQTLFAVRKIVPNPDVPDTFSDVGALLSPGVLINRARSISRSEHPELIESLQRISEMEDIERSGIRNMYARLHTLTTSTAGSWLRRDPNPNADERRDIDLRRIADEGQVAVFSLDTSNYEETAKLVAGLIVQDLKTLSSELRHNPAPSPFHVYVDEFSAVETTNILGLLAKARDARMPVTIVTQALADLARQESTFVEQVLGIISAFIVHRANTENDARIFAGLTGLKMKTVERTQVEQTSALAGSLGAAANKGAAFLYDEEVSAVYVGAFQELERGECIYIAKSPAVRYVNPVDVVLENPMKVAADYVSRAKILPAVEKNNIDSFVEPEIVHQKHDANNFNVSSPSWDSETSADLSNSVVIPDDAVSSDDSVTIRRPKIRKPDLSVDPWTAHNAVVPEFFVEEEKEETVVADDGYGIGFEVDERGQKVEKDVGYEDYTKKPKKKPQSNPYINQTGGAKPKPAPKTGKKLSKDDTPFWM